LLKGAIAGGALIGLRQITNSQEKASTPRAKDPETVDRDENPQIAELYLGTVKVTLTEIIDEETGLPYPPLKIRTAPFTSKQGMVDNRQVNIESTEIDWDKIIEVNGVNIQNEDYLSIENPTIVHGENVVRRQNVVGNRWIQLDVRVDDRFGRDDNKKAYINFSDMTYPQVQGTPAPESSGDSGFVQAHLQGNTLLIVENGQTWVPFGEEVNKVSLPSESESQE
jgi:hypothetical protein